MALSSGHRSATGGGSVCDPNSYWAMHPPEYDPPEESDEFSCGDCDHYKRRKYKGKFIHYCQIHRWEVSNADYCSDFEPKEDYELYDYEG